MAASLRSNETTIIGSVQAVEKGPPALLRSIASLQRISKYAYARRFLARLASGPFLNSLESGFFNGLCTIDIVSGPTILPTHWRLFVKDKDLILLSKLKRGFQ